MINFINEIDWAILYSIHENIVNTKLNNIMIFFTVMGNIGIIWILLGIFLIFFKEHRILGIMILIGLLTELIFGNGLLKNFVGRARPCWIDTSIQLLIRMPKDYSFPSGHTFSSFISATLIYEYNKKWGLYAIATALVIAFSRLYLFVHFPSDVATGILLGVFFGIIIYKIKDIIIEKYDLHV